MNRSQLTVAAKTRQLRGVTGTSKASSQCCGLFFLVLRCFCLFGAYVRALTHKMHREHSSRLSRTQRRCTHALEHWSPVRCIIPLFGTVPRTLAKDRKKKTIIIRRAPHIGRRRRQKIVRESRERERETSDYRHLHEGGVKAERRRRISYRVLLLLLSCSAAVLLLSVLLLALCSMLMSDVVVVWLVGTIDDRP